MCTYIDAWKTQTIEPSEIRHYNSLACALSPDLNSKDMVQPPLHGTDITSAYKAALHLVTTITTADLTLVMCSVNPAPLGHSTILQTFFKKHIVFQVHTRNPAFSDALLRGPYSCSACLDCRLRYSCCFPLCNRLSPSSSVLTCSVKAFPFLYNTARIAEQELLRFQCFA